MGVRTDNRTNPPTRYIECGWAPGKAPAYPGDIPIPAISNPDLRNRLQRLAAVVNCAEAVYRARYMLPGSIEGTYTQNVLKVFTVPEFYFRPPASGRPGHRTYGKYSSGDLQELLKAIEQMFRDVRFADWLFVCGTAIFAGPEVDPGVDPLIFNYAMCKMGGPSNEGYYISKTQASDLDGILDENSPNAYIGLAMQSQEFQHNRVLQPLSIGMEICLDHIQKILKRTLDTWGPTPPRLKLHLLIAGGMTIDADAIVSSVGKYFFRNDGMCGARSNSQLEQVTQRSATGQVATVNIPSEYTLPIPPEMQLPPPPPSPLGAYAAVPQQVVFYPLQTY